MSGAEHESKFVRVGDIIDRIGRLEKSTKDSSKVQSKDSDRREWIKVIITVPSAVAVAVGLIIQIYNFLEYKNKALELTLSKEILSLNEQLNNAKSADMKRDAIFLLATLGPDAAPLLVYHIKSAGKKSSIVDAIGFGLKQIVEKNKKGDFIEREKRVTEILNIRTEDLINIELNKSVPGLQTIRNHINVITRVYPSVNCEQNEYRAKINSFLINARNIVAKEKQEVTFVKDLEKIFDKGIKATSC